MKTCAKCGFAMDDDALYCARCGLYSGTTVRDDAPLNFDKDDDAPLNFDKDDETPPPPPRRRWSEEPQPQTRRTFEAPRDEGAFPNGDASRRSEEADYAPKNFADALTVCVGKKYCVFRGRAGRSEFWMFYAWQWILSVGAALFTNGWPALVLIVPSFAALARRLHDADYSARHMLWAAVPIVGWLVLLVLTLQPSTPGPNRFGAPSIKP